MAPRGTSANGPVKTVKAPPTQEEAHIAQEQLLALLSVDAGLTRLIDIDVNKLGKFPSPFMHPLYGTRIKLEALRRQPVRILGARGRAERKFAAAARRAEKASA